VGGVIYARYAAVDRILVDYVGDAGRYRFYRLLRNDVEIGSRMTRYQVLCALRDMGIQIAGFTDQGS
jgi:hypothetical protein